MDARMICYWRVSLIAVAISLPPQVAHASVELLGWAPV
jgi:hypothetical protein